MHKAFLKIQPVLNYKCISGWGNLSAFASSGCSVWTLTWDKTRINTTDRLLNCPKPQDGNQTNHSLGLAIHKFSFGQKKCCQICHYRQAAVVQRGWRDDFILCWLPCPRPPPPLHCCNHAPHRDKQAHNWKYPAANRSSIQTKTHKKKPVRSPFSMQAWSYLRSTNSEIHSLLLVFNVLVATMVTVLIPPGAVFLWFQQSCLKKKKKTT